MNKNMVATNTADQTRRIDVLSDRFEDVCKHGERIPGELRTQSCLRGTVLATMIGLPRVVRFFKRSPEEPGDRGRFCQALTRTPTDATER